MILSTCFFFLDVCLHATANGDDECPGYYKDWWHSRMLLGSSTICVIFPVTDASWIVGWGGHLSQHRRKAQSPPSHMPTNLLQPAFSCILRPPVPPTSASPLLPLSQVITLTVNAQKFLCDTLKAHYCFEPTSRNTVKA